MRPFASRGTSMLVATGGVHSSRGLPTGGVTSQEKTAAFAAENAGAPQPGRLAAPAAVKQVEAVEKKLRRVSCCVFIGRPPCVARDGSHNRPHSSGSAKAASPA